MLKVLSDKEKAIEEVYRVADYIEHEMTDFDMTSSLTCFCGAFHRQNVGLVTVNNILSPTNMLADLITPIDYKSSPHKTDRHLAAETLRRWAHGENIKGWLPPV